MLILCSSAAELAREARVVREVLPWGHPTYSGTQYMKLFTVPCGAGVKQMPVGIVHRASEFEVQTEGGPETAYVIKVNVYRGTKLIGEVDLNHAGSLELATRGTGFSLQRSSGPNQYGEQNLRVKIPDGKVVNTRVQAEVMGNSDAQLAMRWGHTDFHDNEYFPIWTVKKGPAQSKTFRLTDPASEFEIQTQGGTNTSYHLSVWLDLGQGVQMQPSIEINHALKGVSVFTSSSGPPDGATFNASRGNAYGEMNVGVSVPGLPEETVATGPGSLNVRYQYGRYESGTAQSVPINVQYVGSYNPNSSTATEGRQSFTTSKNELIGPVGDNVYIDGEGGLRPGDWTVTVKLSSGGKVFDVLTCSAKVAAGNAASLVIDRRTRTCA